MGSNKSRPQGRLAIAIAMALAASCTQAATITVDSADDDAASTFCNLRDAMGSILTAGTSSFPTCSGAVTGAFGSNDTIVFAAGLANATITLTQGALGVVNETVTGSGQIIDGGGASQVLDLPYATTTTTLSNLTLTNGHSANVGGAIHLGTGGTLTLTNCTISNSSAVTNGGGIYSNGGSVTLTNTTVSGNTATAQGGGIFAQGGTLSLNASTVSNNTATDSGGGIVVSAGNILSVSHSTVSGNTGIRAGGIYLLQSNGTLTSTTITGNTGTCGPANGFCAGGLYFYVSTAAVIDSTISGNMAKGANDFQAGGVYSFNSTSTFVNSTITGNSAAGNSHLAGALWEAHDPVKTYGMTLINSTVASNSVSSYSAGTQLGGGIEVGVNAPNYAGTLTLSNTIVSSNLPADTDIVAGPAGTTTAAYSLLGSALNVSPYYDVANHNVFSDTPGLGPLQNNGGPTQTLALTPGSPALRAGSAALAAYASVPLHYDQRGIRYVRTFSGTVDIGAYEDQGERIFADGLEAEP